MANMGLSAKQEKDVQILKMKQEVTDMVKVRTARMKSKVCRTLNNSVSSSFIGLHCHYQLRSIMFFSSQDDFPAST